MASARNKCYTLFVSRQQLMPVNELFTSMTQEALRHYRREPGYRRRIYILSR